MRLPRGVRGDRVPGRALLALAAAGATAAAAAALRTRRDDTDGSPPPARPEEPARDDLLERYRTARRAFGVYREAPDEKTLTALRDSAHHLWRRATLAEPFSPVEARRLARAARKLVAVIDEHRDLAGIAAEDRSDPAVETFLEARRTRLERRIRRLGKEQFAAKPARVARRVAEDRPGDQP